MEANLALGNTRYLLVTSRQFSLTGDNLYAVNEMWAVDLNAHLTAFPNLHIFAPFDPQYQSVKYNFVFSKESTITFHCLPNFVSTRDCLKKLPQTLGILIRNIQKEDIVQSEGDITLPVGALALVLCALMRHHKRILILDADPIGVLEVRVQSEQQRMRKSLLIILRHLVRLAERFLIAISPLTFVVGDSLYSTYAHGRNVKKIYASWLSKNSTITHAALGRKIRTTLNRPSLSLVFAGRLVRQKAPDIAVKVAAILDKRGIAMTLDVYGEGPMRDELLDLIARNGLSGAVALKGNVSYDNFRQVLTKYDILLLPSLSEEQPRVLFDAMANGVLVIASDIASLSGLITNSYNGMLCEPGNPESFALAIEHLYLNKKDIGPLLRKGVLMSRENTIESMHEKRKSIILATFYDYL
jgi:glycosyltransferase involved in cell wall biosynthesis